MQAIWIYVSYHVLQYFNERKELQCIEAEDGTGQTYFVTASIAQRWLHPVVDRLVTLVLFSPIIDFFMDLNIKNITNAAILPATILFSILFYYLFYETVLGITPAKLITQTRVVGYNDKKLSFKTILIRTICRLVPFEAFSFFTEDGWHDKWSQTVVAKEQESVCQFKHPLLNILKLRRQTILRKNSRCSIEIHLLNYRYNTLITLSLQHPIFAKSISPILLTNKKSTFAK